MSFGTALALCALLMGAARAAPAPERGAQAEAVRAERDACLLEAALLAERIAALKSGSRGPRAGAELADRLRAFDRLALALDELERRLARLERATAEAPPAGLEQGDLRPLLDIELGPADFGSALVAKLALLQAEQARGREQARHLDSAAAVLELRLAGKQRLAREAEAGRREAGANVSLLQRQADQLKLELRELLSARAVVERRRAELGRELFAIEQRLAEADERQRTGAGSATP